MKVSIIGAGRVGLSLGAVLARSGFSVSIADKDSTKKQAVRGKALPFYEPGLLESLQKNQSHLQWVNTPEEIIASDFIFFCLSAPIDKKGNMDRSGILLWVDLIIEAVQNKARQGGASTKALKEAAPEKLLIIKSTFPLGTNRQIQTLIKERKAPFCVITCPEFLRQGHALRDIAFPERLVIGSKNKEVAHRLEQIYQKISRPKNVIHTDPQTAELAKLACNSFLALKISFANEFAGLCESLQADPEKLRLILGSDPRIGADFLMPGLGYGGSCIPENVKMSLQEGAKRGYKMPLLKSAQTVNSSLTSDFFNKIQERYKSLKDLPLAFWGISFKKNTDDLNHSPALDLLCRLLKKGAILNIYDPLFVGQKADFADQDTLPASLLPEQKTEHRTAEFLPERGPAQKELTAIENLQPLPESKPAQRHNPIHDRQVRFLRKNISGGKAFFCKTALESLKNCQGLIIGSDCEEFQKIPLSEIKKRMSKAFLVDGRNLFSTEELKKQGFDFYQKGILFSTRREK